MNKVVRDGKVAVLYSPGYGSGWSSWNQDYPQCVFEPRIVEAVERGASADEIEKIVDELYGGGEQSDFYAGGAANLTIHWVPVGTHFKIAEYDGSESVEILTPDTGFIA